MKIAGNKKQIGILIYEAVCMLFFGIFLSLSINPVLGIVGTVLFVLVLYYVLKGIFAKEKEWKKPPVSAVLNAVAGAAVLGNGFAALVGMGSLNKNLLILVAVGLAVTASVFAPLLYFANQMMQKEDLQKGDYSEICLSAAMLFLTFVVMFDAPTELFLVNNSEFNFSYGDLMRALYPVISLSIMPIPVLILLPRVVKRNLAALFASITVCVYLQIMFFNKYIGEITGAHYNWKENPVYSLICTSFWILIPAVLIVLANRGKKVLLHLFGVGAAFVLVLSSVLFVMIRAPKDYYSRKQFYLDSAEQFTVGTGRNVVILIADAVDNTYVEKMRAERPELFEPFRDFTLYTDTCSVYDITNQSVEQMLYGYTQRDGSQNTDRFFGIFKDAGYRILMFHAAALGLDMEDKPVDYIDNYVSTGDTKEVRQVNYEVIRKEFVKLSLFKALPCLLKGYLNVENVSFTSCIVYSSSKYEMVNDNEKFAVMLKLRANEVSENCFIYQHLNGAHFPCDDYIGESEYCLEIFAEYIEQMKEIGSYDDSVIIIAADHGMHDDAEGVPFGVAATPMFLIKQPGEQHDSVKISSKPMYYRDIQATLLKYAGLYDEECEVVFGKTIDDYSEGDIRTRVWFDQGFIHNGVWRKYTYSGDYNEFKRVVEAGIYEDVPDGSFDFSELDNR